MQSHTRIAESRFEPEPPGEFQNITEKLRACPDAVSTEDKAAYKDFVLSLSPPELTLAEIGILEKVSRGLESLFGTSLRRNRVVRTHRTGNHSRDKTNY